MGFSMQNPKEPIFFNHFYASEGFEISQIKKGGEVGIIGKEIFGVGIHAGILKV
jgi:hypothetical protein